MFRLSAQVAAFASAGFLHRKGLQYHWRNRDRSSSNSNNSNNNNNGAKKGDTAAPNAASSDSAGVLGTATPAETAQEGVGVGEVGEDDGDKKMYRDFDAYLGNFASKRRIKVCKRVKANARTRNRGRGYSTTPGLSGAEFLRANF